jgi:hypothetical protein
MVETYRIGHFGSLTPVEADILDPRGIVWVFEPPSHRQTYVLGCDPTKGITGWRPELRTQDDAKIDNGAIEIIRKGRSADDPDVQVCEFAAPIDPYELAVYCNLLGRLYAGSDESGQCLTIIEVWPGPGLPTQRELINRYGYTNLFVWKYLDSLSVRATHSLGWTSTQKSVRDLWIMGTRHIQGRHFLPASPWLVDEMADCETDMNKMAGKAIYGRHDDRVRALLMAIWAAHDWTFQADIPDEVKVDTGAPGLDWQRSDISAEDMYSEWEERFSASLDN